MLAVAEALELSCNDSTPRGPSAWVADEVHATVPERVLRFAPRRHPTAIRGRHEQLTPSSTPVARGSSVGQPVRPRRHSVLPAPTLRPRHWPGWDEPLHRSSGGLTLSERSAMSGVDAGRGAEGQAEPAAVVRHCWVSGRRQRGVADIDRGHPLDDLLLVLAVVQHRTLPPAVPVDNDGCPGSCQGRTGSYPRARSDNEGPTAQLPAPDFRTACIEEDDTMSTGSRDHHLQGRMGLPPGRPQTFARLPTRPRSKIRSLLLGPGSPEGAGVLTGTQMLQ